MKSNIYFALISTVIVCSTIIYPQFSKSSVAENMKDQIKYITEIKGIKEYTLSNGIKILLKANHSIPLVTFSIWYKVGSRNESSGIRGLAHFLEHMMFKGTSKFKKGEISETIQNLGGVFNAFTSNDGTAYYETISPKYLEKMMEIESDRMKNSNLDEGELNLEKNVVLSELEGNLNNPVTLLDQELHKHAYNIHPYKHPVIGYIDDIKNLNSSTMKDFYKKFYSPHNATIIVVGDFNEDNALRLITQYFGNIKNDSVKNDFKISQETRQNNEKRFSVTRAGSFNLLEISYHIVNVGNNDIYPLNIIEEILIKGKKSKLNKALVEKGLATEIVGGAEANCDPGLFYITVSLTPKATHKVVEKIILNEIDALIKNPPDLNEINSAKSRIKANYLFNLDGSYNLAVNLGYFELINSWKQAVEWTDKIEKVTREEVSEALKNYFTKENRTIGYFIPQIVKGQKYEAVPLGITRTQHYTDTGNKLQTTSQTSDTKQLALKPFKYKKVSLPDGSKLLIYNDIDLPITYLSGVIKGGSSLFPKEMEWYCQLIPRTLEKGSKKYTKEDIDDFLDNSGSQIEFSCDEESFKFGFVALNEKLIETLELLNNVLMHPVFPDNEIKKEKLKAIAEIIESKDSTNVIAKNQFSRIIYPPLHPYYTNNFDADIKLVKKLNAEKMFDVHETLIKKNKFIITLVTNLNDAKINEVISRLEENLGKVKKEENAVNIPDTLLRDLPKVEITQTRDKLQSDIYIGHAGNLKRTDPDFYKMYIANYILGGSSLTSRLAKKVRDDSGLVYHIHSYINASLGKGEFGIYLGTNNLNVDKSIKLTKEEVDKFVKSGITEDELAKTKISLIDSFVSRNLSTYGNIGNTISGVEFYGLGEDYINNYPKIINSITLNEVNNAIKKYIFPEKLNVSISGDYKGN